MEKRNKRPGYYSSKYGILSVHYSNTVISYEIFFESIKYAYCCIQQPFSIKRRERMYSQYLPQVFLPQNFGKHGAHFQKPALRMHPIPSWHYLRNLQHALQRHEPSALCRCLSVNERQPNRWKFIIMIDNSRSFSISSIEY